MKRLYKKSVAAVSIFVCLVLFCAGNAPCGMTIGDYLASAENDATLDFPDKKIAFLRASSSNTPLLSEVELRVDIDKFKSDGQTYAVRLKPNGWGEARDGRRVYDATLTYGETERDLFYNLALKNRYMTVIDFLFNTHIMALNEELMVLYQDRVNVLRQMAASSDFNGNDLIDVENDIIRLELDLINLKNDAVTIEDEIRRNVPGGKIPEGKIPGGKIPDGKVRFDSEKIVGIAEIETVADGILREAGAENVYLENARTKAELADARLRLEQSENKRYLKFVEASYDMDDRDDFEQAFSVKFGFSIPIVNPNRLDTNRRKLASLEARSKYETAKTSATRDIILLSRNLKRLIRQYEVLAEKKSESGAESSFRVYRRVDGVSPLILLKLKESMVKTEIAMEKTRRRIYEKYVRLLDISGRLSQKPMRNHLSAG